MQAEIEKTKHRAGKVGSSLRNSVRWAIRKLRQIVAAYRGSVTLYFSTSAIRWLACNVAVQSKITKK